MTQHEIETQETERRTDCEQPPSPQHSVADNSAIDASSVHSSQFTDVASGSTKFATRIKVALQSAWQILKSFPQNPGKVASIAVREKDFPVSLVLMLTFAISFLLFNLFLNLSLHKEASNLLNELDFLNLDAEEILRFEFGRILLFSFAFPVVVCGTYVALHAICTKATGNKTGLTVRERFIEFSVFSVPVSILLPIAGLFFFISPNIGALLTVVGFIYLTTLFILKTSTTLTQDLFSTKSLLLSTASAALFAGFVVITLVAGILWYLGLSELIDMLEGLLYYANF